MMARPSCFFVMPFTEELNFFYLFLKNHIESNFALEVERGDSQCLTKPVADKLTELIRRARIVIADLSGANPNVLYEVGLAHAFDRPVIFLTRDDPGSAPFDLRHYDIVAYQPGDPEGLLRRLDAALRAELAEQFGDLYEHACATLDEVNRARGTALAPVSRDVFHQRIATLVSMHRLPDVDDDLALAESLLPRVVEDSTDMRTIRAITGWLDQRFP